MARLQLAKGGRVMRRWALTVDERILLALYARAGDVGKGLAAMALLAPQGNQSQRAAGLLAKVAPSRIIAFAAGAKRRVLQPRAEVSPNRSSRTRQR
jgi:hypothetical protein